jgi:hypothetical protein
LDGTADTARFFLSEDAQTGRKILNDRDVTWVFAYDADRVARNSAAILGSPIPANPLCRVINRTPARAPSYLIFSAQNGAAKLFRVQNSP